MPVASTAKLLPAALNLQAYQGDDWRFLLLFGPQTYESYAQFHALGNGFDTSGWTFAAEVRRTAKEARAVLTFSFDTSQAQFGAVALVVDASVTDVVPPGSYVWDLEAIINGKERTLLAGTFLIKAKVTR